MGFPLLNTFDRFHIEPGLSVKLQAVLILALGSPSSKLKIGWPIDAQPI